MNSPGQTPADATTQAIEISIRLVIIFLIFAWCLQILSPFISVVAWGAIIAVAIYPMFRKLSDKLGGKKKLAVSLITILALAIILLPVISLSGSAIESATEVGTKIAEGNAHIPPPSDAVKEWPLIGEKAHGLWQQASDNLTAFLERYASQLSGIGKRLVGFAASIGLGVVQFIISLLIAAAFLAGADTINATLKRLALRLSGGHGEALLNLSEKTVRSVAVGVIGIAFIQAVLAGIGMMIASVPGAGLLAVIALVLGIAQLPPLLVLAPVCIYLFSGDSTGMAIFFVAWTIMVAASDLVLKPLLLGRGVDAPMLIILLGAIGGMLTAGIVGLFIGAVILAVGYKLFLAWIELGEPEALTSVGAEPAGE